MNGERPTVQEILARPRIPVPAFCGNHVLFWTRLALFYRLLLRAKDVGLQVESAPTVRQREAARREFSLNGGDLGS